MILYVKNNQGKDFRLAISGVQTRKDMAEMHGATFSIGPSDTTYHVCDVYAKESPDSTYGMGVLAIIFSILFTKDAIIAITFTFMIMAFTKLYFWFDKRAVRKFNESTYI